MTESNESATLSVLGRRALRDFAKLIETSPDRRILDTEHQRLELWSASLGLIGEPHSSLDHRLRNAVLVRETVTDLLSDLCTATAALLEIYTGRRLPYDQEHEHDLAGNINIDPPQRRQAELDTDSSDDSDGSSDCDECLDQISQPMPSEVETRLSEVVDIVDKLYKFAIDVRNSATRSGPGDRNPFRKFPVEKQQEIFQDLGRFEEVLVTRHLNQVCESTKSDETVIDAAVLALLIRRCGRANVLRRQYFRIWRERKDKEHRNVNQLLEINPTGAAPQLPRTTVDAYPAGMDAASAFKNRSVIAPSFQNTVTTVDPTRIRRTGGSSKYSRATRSAPALGPLGSKPPWPSSLSLPTTEYFECPYCFFICPSKYRQSEDAWRNHVTNDIRPYLCTYPACESADQLYQSRSDWRDHESNAHRRIWRCPDHPAEEYSMEEYTAHIRKEHAKYQIELMSTEGLRAAESTAIDYERPCPFCGSTFKSSEELETHVVYHLECIALLTLPQVEEAEDDALQEEFDSNFVIQSDDSRFEDTQLSRWLREDNVDESGSNAGGTSLDTRNSELSQYSLESHQSEYESRFLSADLTKLWLSALGVSPQALYGGNEEMVQLPLEKGTDVDAQGREYGNAFQAASSGGHEEAEEMHRQESRLTERMLGKEHPSILTSMKNPAEVLTYQGKYKEAEERYRQALRLAERMLGKEHPSTLISMNNLAEVLSHQGKYEEAEEIYRQALRERMLGKEHPITLTSMNNLAEVLSHQGKYEEAEEIYRQALRLRERVLGKEHPITLTSMNNLAEVLSHQGKYEEAEEIYRQALRLRERVLGKEHPSTDEYEESSRSTKPSGQVRGGGRDISIRVKAKGDGARERASTHADEHK